MGAGFAVANVPSHRSPVADEQVGELPRHVREDRVPLRGERGIEKVARARRGADPQHRAVLRNVGKADVSVDVGGLSRERQPQLHEQSQAVPSGEDPGLAPEATQHTDRLVEGVGRVVLESWRYQQRAAEGGPERTMGKRK